MKKKIALLILLILALSFALTACGSTPQTEVNYRRWYNDDEKTFRFHVSKADFATDSNGAELNTFAGHTDSNNNAAYKDIAMSGEVFSSMDEIKPVAVDGTFTLSIKKDGDDRRLETTQTLYVLYNLTSTAQNGSKVVMSDELKQCEAPSEELTNTSLKPTGDQIVLKSVSTTEVFFKVEYAPQQLPSRSKITMDGFYFGYAHQEKTYYNIDTNYTYTDNNPVAKVVTKDRDEQPTEEENVSLRSGTIDSAQLLLYLRSLKKSADSFQDTPSVYVFNPLTKKTSLASFRLNKLAPMVITDDTREKDNINFVALNVTSVFIDGMAFLAEEDVPEEAKIPSEQYYGLDLTTPIYKHTTVRFRSGYLSYELQQYPADIWDGLKQSYSTETPD